MYKNKVTMTYNSSSYVATVPILRKKGQGSYYFNGQQIVAVALPRTLHLRPTAWQKSIAHLAQQKRRPVSIGGSKWLPEAPRDCHLCRRPFLLSRKASVS